MEIKNISLALWDTRPLWDKSDSYSKYIDQVEPGSNKKQKDVGRYRIDMIAHDRNIGHKMACKLLWPLSRHTEGNQYKMHKDWYNEQFEYVKELKDNANDGMYDMIHPPLVGIPYRPGGKMNKRRIFEEPSIFIAMRMRPAGDLWDQQTIHHWLILWRVKTGDQVKTLQFKIEDKKIEEGINNTVCRRTKFPYCPIDLPNGLFRYGMEEGTHIRDEEEADYLAEYTKHKIKERKSAKNYQSKFANTKNNDKEREQIKKIAKAWSIGQIILPDQDIQQLAKDLQKYNLTIEEIIELEV